MARPIFALALALMACSSDAPEQIQGRWIIDTQALFAEKLVHLSAEERREAEALAPMLLDPISVIITADTFELKTQRRHLKGPISCDLNEQGWVLRPDDGAQTAMLVRPVEGGGIRLDFEGRYLVLKRAMNLAAERAHR